LNVKSGLYSCRHSAIGSETKNLGQIVTVNPTTLYRLSFYFKTEVINNEHGCRIWCSWKDASSSDITDAAAKLVLQPSNYMKSDTWLLFTVEINSPPNAKYFNLEVRTYQNTIAYFDDFVFQENVATGTPHAKEEEIIIYPNPVKDFLNISNTISVLHIDIKNLCGVTLWSSDFAKEGVISIPVSWLTEGIYLVYIRTSDKYINRKFIKVQ
jgi:hypothetical protein